MASCPGHLVDSGTQCTCNSTSYFDSTFYLCRDCTDIDASCTACSYDGVNFEGDCTACSSGSPSGDGRSCVGGGCTPITNCQTINADCVTCDLCSTNYWRNATPSPDTCLACSLIDVACTACNHGGSCTACSGGKVPQTGGLSCVTPAANCATLDASD